MLEIWTRYFESKIYHRESRARKGQKTHGNSRHPDRMFLRFTEKRSRQVEGWFLRFFGQMQNWSLGGPGGEEPGGENWAARVWLVCVQTVRVGCV